MDKVVLEDSRNKGLFVKVTFEKYYKFNTLVVNYQAVTPPADRLSVLRSFLQFSRDLAGRNFEKVIIAYRGVPRMMIYGDTFTDLGEKYGNDKPVEMLLHLATNLRHLNGDRVLTGKSSHYASILEKGSGTNISLDQTSIDDIFNNLTE